MSANNHPADQAAIESLHSLYSEHIADHLIALQDDAYAMGRARGQQDAAPAWSVTEEAMPESKSQVLAWFGDKQRVALYVGPKSISTEDRSYDGDAEYDEATDTFYWPEGWYCFEDGMEMWMSSCSKPSHWMPLPAAPGAQA